VGQVGYKPNRAALAHLSSVDFVAIVGPTAAGKTTLIRTAMAANSQVQQVLVTTSRDPRPGEQDGVDYSFRSQVEMHDRMKRGEFVQVAPSILGALYATLPEAYAKDGFSVMAVIVQAIPDFLALPFKRMRQIYILPPSWDVWKRRIDSHNFTPKQLEKRLAEAKISLTYAAVSEDVLYVKNDDLALASAEFSRIIMGQKPAVSRLEGQMFAQNLLPNL
jgi:guanylate kinase